MRSLLFLFLAAGLAAAAPQVRILSAELLVGPGREPRPGDPPFRPRLEVEVAVAGLRAGTTPAFRIWLQRAGARPERIRAEALTSEGPDRYRLLASPEGRPDRVVVDLQVRGRRAARAAAPVRVRALPASPPRPRGGKDPRS